jgi:hypothetical protein
MGKHDDKAAQPFSEQPAAPAQTITTDALSTLIAAAVRAEVAKLMTQSTPDEQIVTALDRARGKDKPLPKEDHVKCVSPLTGARFTAHLLWSRTYPEGRVIEIEDYERPPGWDVSRANGGAVPDGLEMKDQSGRPAKRYTNWLRIEYWQKDLVALISKPLPAQWRAENAPEPGSVTLSPAQLAKLGITAADVADAARVTAA